MDIAEVLRMGCLDVDVNMVDLKGVHGRERKIMRDDICMLETRTTNVYHPKKTVYMISLELRYYQ